MTERTPREKIKRVRRWALLRLRTASAREAKALREVLWTCEFAEKHAPAEPRRCRDCAFGEPSVFGLFLCEDPQASGARRDVPHEANDGCRRFRLWVVQEGLR